MKTPNPSNILAKTSLITLIVVMLISVYSSEALASGDHHIDLSCAISSPTQTGWYGTYYNYSSTTLGMELPISEWDTSFGDPLGVDDPWTANWYDLEFARFNRIDANLLFGGNFFPFDSNPEE